MFKFNPLILSGLDLVGEGGSGGSEFFKDPVASEGGLPTVGNANGDVRLALNTDTLYAWDQAEMRWIQQPNQQANFGTTPNAQGYSIILDDNTANIRRRALELQPADSLNPGGVSILAQNFAGNKTFDNEVTVTQLLTASANLQVDGTATVDVDLNVGQNVVITGDLTVNGTTTTINTTNLDVTDQNITVNDGGNDVSAEGAGLTIQRSGTDGSLVYQEALASRWAGGPLGSEIEFANISSTQTLTNKTIDADSNTITNIEDADIKAGADINASKIATGVVNNTEFNTLNGVTSSIQGQLDAKQPLDPTLTALAAYNTDGLLVQTAPDTFAGRSIESSGNSVTVTNGDGVSGNIDLEVNPANVNHDDLNGFVANEHIDHSTVSMNTGANSGLTGGGDLTVSRDLSVDINGTTELTAPAAADTILVYDDNLGVLRKVTLQNIISAFQAPDDQGPETFALQENQVAQSTNVTINIGQTRSAVVQYSLYLDATTDLYQEGEIRILQTTTGNFELSRNFTGDDMGLEFSMIGSGNLRCTTPSFPGFVSLRFSNRVSTTII